MNTIEFIRPIFLKDVRRYRLPLGMVFAMELTIALSIHGDSFYVLLAAICYYLIGLYLTMALIQLDWPGRHLQFIFTRPVPGEAVFFAKILFLGLFLVLTGWGFKEIDYAILGMPLQPLDHLCLLVETSIFTGAAMAVMALFALFLRKLSHVFLAFGIALIANLLISVARTFLPEAATISTHYNHAQLYWNGLVVLVGLCGFIGLVALAALIRYRTHQFGVPLILVIAGISLGLVIFIQACVIGDKRLAHDRPDHLPPHLREQIRVTSNSFLQQNGQTESNGIVYHFVEGPNIQGIQPPYYGLIVGYQSTAKLRSGKTIPSIVEQTETTPRLDLSDGVDTSFEAEVIGISPANPRVSYVASGMTLRAFTYLPSRLPAGQDLTGVTIQGEAQLEIHRAYVAGSIPVKPGAVFSRQRQRCEIAAVSTEPGYSSPKGILLKLIYMKLPLMLRGDTGDSSEGLSWALVSRPRREILEGHSQDLGSTFPVDIAVSSRLYLRLSTPTPDHPSPAYVRVPPNWLNSAELVFLGNENCGEITVPFQVDNVNLAR